MKDGRRAFLRGAAVLLGLPCAGAQAMAGVPPSGAAALNGAAALHLLRSEACIGLGRRCAGAMAADAALAKTLAAPAAMEHLLAALAIETDKAAAEELKRLICRDFEAGATVVLDGWVVSQTECRLGLLAFRTGR